MRRISLSCLFPCWPVPAAPPAGCAEGRGPVSGEEINVAVQVNVDARAVESTDGTPTAAEAGCTQAPRLRASSATSWSGYYFNDAGGSRFVPLWRWPCVRSRCRPSTSSGLPTRPPW